MSIAKIFFLYDTSASDDIRCIFCGDCQGLLQSFQHIPSVEGKELRKSSKIQNLKCQSVM